MSVTSTGLQRSVSFSQDEFRINIEDDNDNRSVSSVRSAPPRLPSDNQAEASQSVADNLAHQTTGQIIHSCCRNSADFLSMPIEQQENLLRELNSLFAEHAQKQPATSGCKTTAKVVAYLFAYVISSSNALSMIDFNANSTRNLLSSILQTFESSLAVGTLAGVGILELLEKLPSLGSYCRTLTVPSALQGLAGGALAVVWPIQDSLNAQVGVSGFLQQLFNIAPSIASAVGWSVMALGCVSGGAMALPFATQLVGMGADDIKIIFGYGADKEKQKVEKIAALFSQSLNALRIDPGTGEITTGDHKLNYQGLRGYIEASQQLARQPEPVQAFVKNLQNLASNVKLEEKKSTAVQTNNGGNIPAGSLVDLAELKKLQQMVDPESDASAPLLEELAQSSGKSVDELQTIIQEVLNAVSDSTESQPSVSQEPADRVVDYDKVIDGCKTLIDSLLQNTDPNMRKLIKEMPELSVDELQQITHEMITDPDLREKVLSLIHQGPDSVNYGYPRVRAFGHLVALASISVLFGGSLATLTAGPMLYNSIVNSKQLPNQVWLLLANISYFVQGIAFTSVLFDGYTSITNAVKTIYKNSGSISDNLWRQIGDSKVELASYLFSSLTSVSYYFTLTGAVNQLREVREVIDQNPALANYGGVMINLNSDLQNYISSVIFALILARATGGCFAKTFNRIYMQIKQNSASSRANDIEAGIDENGQLTGGGVGSDLSVHIEDETQSVNAVHERTPLLADGPSSSYQGN